MGNDAPFVKMGSWVPSSLVLTEPSRFTVARRMSVNIVSSLGGDVRYSIIGDVRRLSNSN